MSHEQKTHPKNSHKDAVRKFYHSIIPQKNDLYAWVNFLKFLNRDDSKLIRKFRGLHAGKTIVITASGPSLRYESAEVLREYAVIAYNGSYSFFGDCRPKYFYSCVGGIRQKQLADIDRRQFDASFRPVGAYRGCILRKSAISREDIRLSIPTRLIGYRLVDSRSRFSETIDNGICNAGGGTGLFYAIQIAAFMGAKKIILLGADFGVCASESQGHFGNFGQSREETVEAIKSIYDSRYSSRIKPALQLYKKILNRNKVRIINASYSTADDVNEKMDLSAALNARCLNEPAVT